MVHFSLPFSSVLFGCQIKSRHLIHENSFLELFQKSHEIPFLFNLGTHLCSSSIIHKFYTQMCPDVLNYYKTQKGETL